MNDENHDILSLLSDRRSMRWIRMGSALAVVVAMVAMLTIGVTQASRLAAVNAQIKEKTKHVAELSEQERTLTTNIKQLQRTVAAFAIEAGSAKSKEIVAAVNADPGTPTPGQTGDPEPEPKPDEGGEPSVPEPVPPTGETPKEDLVPEANIPAPDTAINPSLAGILVYIQLGPKSDRKLAESLQTRLTDAGAVAPGIEVVKALPKLAEVRYFADADRPVAEAVAAEATTAVAVPFTARRVRTRRASGGHVEVYFPRSR